MEAILKIDQNGQLGLPKSILDAFHVATPCDVRVDASDGRIQIETVVPRSTEAVLVEENGLLVIDNTGPIDAR